MTESIDAIVVGGGVVGLAIGAELAASNLDVIVLEREPGIGQGISSRNSEVIHAGIYYPHGSLKSELCVTGKQMLYDYCKARNIPFSACGKLIVATTQDEEQGLQDIQDNAIANGVSDLKFLSASAVSKLESSLYCRLALYSPSTGIVSSHDLMAALDADLSRNGGQVVVGTRVDSVVREEHGFLVRYASSLHAEHNRHGPEAMQISCRYFINAAGLGAQALASHCDFGTPIDVPNLYLCKGRYFSYTRGKPFRHLIYPIPDKNTTGLGVHATIDLAGQTRFGPDVEYIHKEDYSLPSTAPANYIEAIKRYFPSVDPDALQPAYAGIRPKIQAAGMPGRDFEVQTEQVHGIKGLAQLFGIESPGLTASLAIARLVKNRLLLAYD